MIPEAYIAAWRSRAPWSTDVQVEQDLVKVEEGPIGTMMDALRERLQPWLGKPRWKQRAERVTLIFKFESESEPVVPMRLKVEINTREQFTVLGHARCWPSSTAAATPSVRGKIPAGRPKAEGKERTARSSPGDRHVRSGRLQDLGSHGPDDLQESV